MPETDFKIVFPDKYKYLPKKQNLYRLFYLVSGTATLISFFSFLNFFFVNSINWLIIFPLVLFVWIYFLISWVINFFYFNFDLNTHNRNIEKFNLISKPTVDILLPICGEDIEILKNTWLHVSRLEYTKHKLNIFVLDDKGDQKAKELAASYGFKYLSRPDKGVLKKAGNLKFGLQHSTGEYIIIFDADFAPRQEFINETIPYLIENKKIGIIQTPQSFEVSSRVNERSMLEYGAGNIQEYFYRIVQVARDRLGGTICVGSSAVYRREALDKVGGTYQIEHSEDVWTGYSLLRVGYSIKYIPIILSVGLCPDDMNAFFKQQTRWCQGSISLATSSFFWNSNVKWYTKLCYISGFMYYITNLLYLFLPIFTITLLYTHFAQITLRNSLEYLPSLVIVIFLMLFQLYPNAKLGTLIAQSAASWSYRYVIIKNLIFRKKEKWVASGIKTGLSNSFKQFCVLIYTYFFSFTVVILILLYEHKLRIFDFNYTLILFWILFHYLSTSMLVGYITQYLLKRRVIR